MNDVVDTRIVRRRKWPTVLVWPVATVLMAVSLTHIVEAFGIDTQWGWPLAQGRFWMGRFEIGNPSGLFRVMTTERPEILIAGSYNGAKWGTYAFK